MKIDERLPLWKKNTSAASVAFFKRYGAKPKIALLHVLGNDRSAGVAADLFNPLGCFVFSMENSRSKIG